MSVVFPLPFSYFETGDFVFRAKVQKTLLQYVSAICATAPHFIGYNKQNHLLIIAGYTFYRCLQI
jgi:hypothetical protein